MFCLIIVRNRKNRIYFGPTILLVMIINASPGELLESPETLVVFVCLYRIKILFSKLNNKHSLNILWGMIDCD